ncbi:hypothetical protein EAF04_004700 [Stromatinia cepivora]|nr:hypothetical protein EAF04_004700 [Stromatinia cepivora]
MKYILLSLFTSTVLAQCPAQSEAGRRLFRCVSTTSGQVAGHPSAKNSAVYEYLGIPFAQPPIGNLRFAPPQPYIGNGSINGTNFGYTCPKLFTGALSLIPSNFPDVVDNYTASGISILNTFSQAGDTARNNEDCLTLNVWTKPQTKPPVLEKQKAVMIWIYGGAFRDGATEWPIYDGFTLVGEENVIMVSINYRVNIFGFSGDATGPTSNYGILDQRLAIEWVYNNIANFGGDPSRITLFGQSAGSCAIDYYSYAYPQNPIANSMIMQSGTIPSLRTFTASQAFGAWRNTSTTLGCGDASQDLNAVIQCMRNPNLTTAAILEVAHLYTWLPSIDNTLVFPDYPARAAAGNVTKTPLLIGNTDNEAGVFASQILMTGAPEQNWSQLTNKTFACPAGARANVSATLGAKTWRYRYFGDFQTCRYKKMSTIFETWPTGEGIPAATSEQIALGKYMRGAWAAFAKDSEKGLNIYGGVDCEDLDLNGEELPLHCGWPSYRPDGETVIRLGWDNQVDIVLDRPEVWDGSC